MANQQQTFSESWHRVANLKVALRPNINTRKQMFRGQSWHILHDPFSNNFYRLQPAALLFVKRLRNDMTIAQVWEQCLQQSPSDTPGQAEIIQLLAQLFHANLLSGQFPFDSQQLFSRYKKQRLKEQRSRFMNLMFLRIPLFDPTPLLNRFTLLEKLLTGRTSGLIWLAIILLAGKTLLENYAQLLVEAPGLLDFSNLILLYGGLLIAKTVHELGHTLFCRKYGGEVHTIGVMLILFAPLPYMDATASWAFRQRRQRIMVASAGMLFEFFTAAVAVLVWANTGPGSIHNLAFNMMIVASISTLLFNINPLLKYDGYYILSDLLDIPNLYQRSSEQLKQIAQRWLLGLKSDTPTTPSQSEAFWLGFYGISSGLYRILIYTSIILLVADRYLMFGLLLMLLCLFNWLVLPLARLGIYLGSSPQLTGRRGRIFASGTAIALALLYLLAAIPAPHNFRAPGIIEADSVKPIHTRAAGQLIAQPIENNTVIRPGTVLARLENPELKIEQSRLAALKAEVEIQLQQSRTGAGAETQDILQRQLANLNEKLDHIGQQITDLAIIAPHTGFWLGRESQQLTGAWLPRGTQLGRILDSSKHSFTAVISQEVASELFNQEGIKHAEVRLVGQSGRVIKVNSYQIIPYQQQELPSAALGWQAGGSVAVSDDPQGRKTLEPYFRIDAQLEKAASGTIYHGQSGQIRFDLPPEPLLDQLLKICRQFFQQRFQV